MIEFDAETTRFLHGNAWWLGRAAKLAYADAAQVEQDAAGWGMDAKFIENEETDTQCFVAHDERAIFVAFRGTETDEVKDFIADARFGLRQFDDAHPDRGEVHAGFRTALASVWNDVTAAIADVGDGRQSIWFTGHSLGAALATLGVARMLSTHEPVHGLYTFGSPRVGNPRFADWFDQRIAGKAFRYVNNHDVVTRVPPRVIGPLEYNHVEEMKYFDEGGSLHTDPDVWYRLGRTLDVGKLNWADAVAGNVDKEAWLASFRGPLRDHDMSHYLRQLERAASNPVADVDDRDFLDRLRSFFGGIF